MNVWFCRDEDGECSVWDGEKKKPEPEEGVRSHRLVWNDNDDQPSVLLAEDGGCLMFGEGFHGVRKGRCKLFECKILKATLSPVK